MATPAPRVYLLNPRELTAEQIAVTFAMTSRSPEPFDEIAQKVSAERAADFNEKWVVGYGHNSVAEHAVLHLAVENVSRLAVDTLENNRLASFTEKSSRYQVIDAGAFHIPKELELDPGLARQYTNAGTQLFVAYDAMLKTVAEHLRKEQAQQDKESNVAHRLRIRRQATDACRALLPAATLTNVGVTMNARTLEHAISKLMSAPLQEEQRLGALLKEHGQAQLPTLVKYANFNSYLFSRTQSEAVPYSVQPNVPPVTATLLEHDHDPYRKLAAAFLFRQGRSHYDSALMAQSMTRAKQVKLIQSMIMNIGSYDAAPREFELVNYTFLFTFDYGALREFRRHRMQTAVYQPLSVKAGYDTPELIEQAGRQEQFDEAIGVAEHAFHLVEQASPAAAQYLVTHAHRQQVVSQMNLRECYHYFNLRSSHLAHQSIREPTLQAMRLAVRVHPELFRFMPLRDQPDWWPH